MENRHAAVAADPEPVAMPGQEEDGAAPLSDRLLTELTTYRTLALRHALGTQPDTALLAALHALCLRAFYRYAQDSCLELDMKIVGFSAPPRGLADTALAHAFGERHQAWTEALPREPEELWDVLAAFNADRRQALFAHCVSLSVNAIHEAYNRRPRAAAHADRLAQALNLDMVAAGWVPTVETFLGRVAKARILSAVREARGDQAARPLTHLTKPHMAEQAQDLLAGTGWLPEPLRMSGRALPADRQIVRADSIDSATGEETAADDGTTAMACDADPDDDEHAAIAQPRIAAE